ncbi:MAG: CHASE domain-containing protein [Desulfobacter sp.]|nr:MAG: CHASE domain-containing protein [Desulfobacter sp.]
MTQDKNTLELSGQISTRTAGIFSTFHRLGLISRWSAWIVLLPSLLITFNAWYFVRGEAIKRAQARFNFRVKTIEAGIYERLQAYEFLLRGGSGLFEASDEVSREEWRTYVTKLQINKYYPGIQGVGFSKQILPSEKEAHLRQIRSEGFHQYTIKPEGDRPEYTSIIFLEPFDWRNQRAFGYDMFSEPTRKEAMIRARDTGIAALSGKVTLVQETVKDIQAGFLIYLAIYRKGKPLETPEHRHDALIGYVYSPFRMNDFMKGILKEKGRYVNLQIFDGEKPLKEALLYRTDAKEEPHNAPEGSHFATEQSILTYAGHHWLLSFISSKYFEENIETGSMNFILLLGITISLLLFGMVLSLAKSHNQAINLANTTGDLKKANIELRKEIMEREQAEMELHKSEQRYKSAQRLGQVGNWEFDLVTEIFWGSDEAKRIFGFNTESKNFTIDEVKKCIPDRERIHQALMDLIENNRPYDLEFEIHPVSGSKQKSIRSIAKLRKDNTGKPCKVEGVIQDITRQKEQERMLLEQEKLQGVLEMAGAICHELNQPLQVISGSSEILMMNIESSDSKYKALTNIQVSIKRMAILMRKIMGITHYQSKPYLKSEIIDIDKSCYDEKKIRR